MWSSGSSEGDGWSGAVSKSLESVSRESSYWVSTGLVELVTEFEIPMWREGLTSEKGTYCSLSSRIGDVRLRVLLERKDLWECMGQGVLRPSAKKCGGGGGESGIPT